MNEIYEIKGISNAIKNDTIKLSIPGVAQLINDMVKDIGIEKINFWLNSLDFDYKIIINKRKN